MNRIRKAITQSERMKAIYSKFPVNYDKKLFEIWKFKINRFIDKVKNNSYNHEKEG